MYPLTLGSPISGYCFFIVLSTGTRWSKLILEYVSASESAYFFKRLNNSFSAGVSSSFSSSYHPILTPDSLPPNK